MECNDSLDEMIEAGRFGGERKGLVIPWYGECGHTIDFIKC